MKKVLLPIAIIIVLAIAAFFYFNTSKTETENVEPTEVAVAANDIFENCQEVTTDNYAELIKSCRDSEETEMNLPLNLRFGMNQQEYLDTISSVLKQSGLTDADLPSVKKGLEYDFVFPKLTIHINPVFTKDNDLYQLEMSLKQDNPDNFVEDPVRQMADFYVNNNSFYQSFDKYTIEHKFFFATKGNQLIVPDRSKGLLLFFNVPQMPEDQYKETVGE